MNKTDILNIPFVSNEKIANICTYKTQGNVKGVFYPRDEKELIYVYTYLTEQELPFKIIGNGSNLLIKEDSNFLFISTKKMQSKARFINDYVYLPSSMKLGLAFEACYKKGWRCFEIVAGIPATLGGALKNNASSFGVSIMDNVEKIKILKDGKIKYLKKDDIVYSYHKTNLDDCLILSAKFKLTKDHPKKILNDFVMATIGRRKTQPSEGSCGSIFRNPEGKYAGELIESCGLKGEVRGGAVVSLKHANFIVNSNQKASFQDVKELIELCENEVLKQHQIKLEREVEIIE